MGLLIYRTGLELPLIEKLGKARKARYVDVVPFIRGEHLQPTFYIAKGPRAFVDDSNVADVVVCTPQT